MLQSTDQDKVRKLSETLLRCSAAAVFIGMGLRGILHDLPLRALFWDADWWTWFANLFGYSWKEWVTSAVVDKGINVLDFCLGGSLLIVGLFLLISPHLKRPGTYFFNKSFLAWHILLILYFLYFKESFWQLGNLIEHSLQMIAFPAFFLGLMAMGLGWPNIGPRPTARHKDKILMVLRGAIALTFIGHGMYAAGLHPVPANFVSMTQSGLGVGEAGARSFLLVVGILDFMAAVLLLLPLRKAWLMALIWVIPWAALTTLARLWSYGGLVDGHSLLTQWFPEVIIRLPHVLVPTVLLVNIWVGKRVMPKVTEGAVT